MRKSYPSDITHKQYELIKPELEKFKKTTKPRAYDFYDILCAIPYDFPEYNSVYYYFHIWSKKDETGKSLIDRILAELVILERLSHNKEPKPTMLIVDSKSIQNADTAEVRGI